MEGVFEEGVLLRLRPNAVPDDPGGSVQSVCGSRLRSRGRWNVHRAGTDARCEMLTLLRCAALAAGWGGVSGGVGRR